MTRFPTYPPDILSRADALLSEKYPDGIVDPRFVEIACEAMMADRTADVHLGNVLMMLADLRDDERCDAFEAALAFYNERNPNAAVQPNEGYVSRLVTEGPLDRAVAKVIRGDA